MCHEVGAPQLELVLFVQTQWSSMSLYLDRALALQKVVSFTAS